MEEGESHGLRRMQRHRSRPVANQSGKRERVDATANKPFRASQRGALRRVVLFREGPHVQNAASRDSRPASGKLRARHTDIAESERIRRGNDDSGPVAKNGGVGDAAPRLLTTPTRSYFVKSISFSRRTSSTVTEPLPTIAFATALPAWNSTLVAMRVCTSTVCTPLPRSSIAKLK